jgi:deoxyribodipyrimidine photo-lyase
VRPVVLWFRRDLRLHDLPALYHATTSGAPIAPLFVVDDRILAGRWPAANRWWFMRAAVAELADELEARGARLTVLRGDPVEIVPWFARAIAAVRVIVSRDRTPYGRRRDGQVVDRLADEGVAFEARRGSLVLEPEDIQRSSGGGYRVFGPFYRAWSAIEPRDVRPAPETLRGAEVDVGGDAGAATIDAHLDPVTPTARIALMPTPGEAAARTRLEAWATSDRLERYASDRDRLDLDGTSRLSQDLRWGLLSPGEVVARTAGPGEGRAKFRAELAWRDFYAHLLWHEPDAARHALRPAFEAVAWERDPAVIEAWRSGTTGYPVVDAAMRQLRATGWMPNRARMITASFLTKHLGVDWRVGEAHFMAHLLDGDPASNNGGWQWAASTGTDAQPWFRIFNPTRQGRRHDPTGDYVRRWVPELGGIAGVEVHEPPIGAYRPPIVAHAEARTRALAAYEGRASAGGVDPGE